MNDLKRKCWDKLSAYANISTKDHLANEPEVKAALSEFNDECVG